MEFINQQSYKGFGLTSISLNCLALTSGKPADWASKICGDLKQLQHRWSEAILKRRKKSISNIYI